MNQQTHTGFVPKNASYFRAKARQALKGNWGIAIGAMILASICGAFSTASLPSLNLDKSINLNLEDLFNGSFFSTENLQSFLKSVGPAFLTALTIGAISFAFLSVGLRLFVGSPVFLGYERFNLSIIDGERPQIKTLFCGFSTAYLKSVFLRILLALVDLLCGLPMLAAGTAGIFLCIPAIQEYIEHATISANSLIPIGVAVLLIGVASIASAVLSIVISLRYRFSFVILSEYPELTAIEAMQKSASLMRGNKWKLFCLNFSFIGWILLSVFFTCGIGMFWVSPYMSVAQIGFYDEIANRRAASEAEFPSLNPDDYNPEF